MSIAVYAGTFDPLTLGHMSIIMQAARVFSHVRILIAVNPDKTPMFTIKDRIKFSFAIFPNTNLIIAK